MAWRFWKESFEFQFQPEADFAAVLRGCLVKEFLFSLIIISNYYAEFHIFLRSRLFRSGVMWELAMIKCWDSSLVHRRKSHIHLKVSIEFQEAVPTNLYTHVYFFFFLLELNWTDPTSMKRSIPDRQGSYWFTKPLLSWHFGRIRSPKFGKGENIR